VKNELHAQLAGRSRKSEGFADTIKRVPRGDTARVAFVDGCTKRGKFGLILLFLALQGPQASPHNLTGVFVTSSLYLLGYEAVEFIGQIDITRWHGGGPSIKGGCKSIVTLLAKFANMNLFVELVLEA
jgi:hypothetical protein